MCTPSPQTTPVPSRCIPSSPRRIAFPAFQRTGRARERDLRRQEGGGLRRTRRLHAHVRRQPPAVVHRQRRQVQGPSARRAGVRPRPSRPFSPLLPLVLMLVLMLVLLLLVVVVLWCPWFSLLVMVVFACIPTYSERSVGFDGRSLSWYRRLCGRAMDTPLGGRRGAWTPCHLSSLMVPPQSYASPPRSDGLT